MPDSHLDRLDTVITDVVAPAAEESTATASSPGPRSPPWARPASSAWPAPPTSAAEAGLRGGVPVVERLAGTCGSTAMVVLMHYAATAVIEAHGPKDVRRAIAAGRT